MNKAFYIVGIVFAVIFSGVISYYSEEVSNARFDSFWNDYSSYSSYGYDDYSYSYYDSSNDEDLTVEAALWSLLFFLSFATIDLLGLLKVKTRTVKVMSIIGLSLTGIFLLWNFGVMSSPGSMSFNEVAPGWSFYAMAMLATSIVGLVQSVRYAKRQAQGVTVKEQNDTSSDLLDS